MTDHWLAIVSTDLNHLKGSCINTLHSHSSGVFLVVSLFFELLRDGQRQFEYQFAGLA